MILGDFYFIGEISSVSATYCLKKIEDVREFLGRHAEKLDKFVEIFCQTFKEQERKGIRQHIVRKIHFVQTYLCLEMFQSKILHPK